MILLNKRIENYSFRIERRGVPMRVCPRREGKMKRKKMDEADKLCIEVILGTLFCIGLVIYTIIWGYPA